jgi:hypothetical protein
MGWIHDEEDFNWIGGGGERKVSDEELAATRTKAEKARADQLAWAKKRVAELDPTHLPAIQAEAQKALDLEARCHVLPEYSDPSDQLAVKIADR